jgi:hypothetical protein
MSCYKKILAERTERTGSIFDTGYNPIERVTVWAVECRVLLCVSIIGAV